MYPSRIWYAETLGYLYLFFYIYYYYCNCFYLLSKASVPPTVHILEHFYNIANGHFYFLLACYPVPRCSKYICRVSAVEYRKFGFSWYKAKWVILACLVCVLVSVTCIWNKVGGKEWSAFGCDWAHSLATIWLILSSKRYQHLIYSSWGSQSQSAEMATMWYAGCATCSASFLLKGNFNFKRENSGICSLGTSWHKI